jgi:hypothetical protein
MGADMTGARVFPENKATGRAPHPAKTIKLSIKRRNRRRDSLRGRRLRVSEAEVAQLRVFHEHHAGHHRGNDRSPGD